MSSKLPVVHLALLLAAWPALPAPGLAQDRQPLDQLLTRLGLADLRLHHLQRLLEKAAAPEQPALARRLADAYAEQMVAAAEDAARFDALKQRVEKLLAGQAEANTPAIQVVLLQADYQRAEALMIRWLESPADKAPLAEAAATLSRIAPQLAAQHQQLAAAAEKIAAAAEANKNEDAKAAADQEVSRLQAVASRAEYFAGWSSYYLGVTRQDPPAAQADFAAAKAMFLGVLDITDDKDYAGVEVDGLALESLWRTRAAIGLGLAEIGLSRLPAAANCFAWLDHASVPTVLRDQAGYWHLQGLLNASKYPEAAELGQNLVSAFSGSPSPGKNSLCIAVIRAAAALPAEPAQQRRQLAAPGIRGLARLRQFETLAQLDAKYHFDSLAEPDDFYLAWLAGRQQFMAAEKAKAEGDYQAAARSLSKALAHPQAKTELTDAAQARYYWAWCEYRLGRPESAAAAFAEAVTALKAALPDVAVQAAWMQCVCLQQLAVTDKKHLGPTMAALQTLIADFPKSEQAAKAEFALTRLRQASATPEQAIASLAAVKPGDANYLAAQYELCQLRYQVWTKVKADATKSQPAAAELLQSVDRFLAAAAKDGDGERKLRAALLAVDVLVAAPAPDWTRIGGLLRGAAPAAEQVGAASSATAEYHYRQLQLAQKTGDEAAAQSAAQWIVENAAGSPYELAALVVAAREADRAVETAGAASRPARTEAAVKVYSRLVELLGDSPTVLASTKNALAAASKLAQYEESLGRCKQAADRLSRLVEAFPKDKGYLRRAGIAHFRAGDHAAALASWRTLLGGLPTDSDEWLEAKFYQLACLLKTDRPAAEQVWRQFKLLYPDVKSAVWRDKFAELAPQFP